MKIYNSLTRKKEKFKNLKKIPEKGVKKLAIGGRLW